MYDQNNIFAKILRKEIPSTVIFEDENVLAFKNIYPEREVHALVIPKGAYENVGDFSENASESEIIAFSRALPKIVEKLGLKENGYRIVSNCGEHGGQEIPHYHVHILGGQKVGPMVSEPSGQ